MNSAPRIFVGTMHTQEGDFPTCIEAIQAQKNVVVSHHIISNLKEKDAHNALWRAWNSAKSSNDLFVKIDADTVLASPDTLSQIWSLFESNPRLTSVQAPLHDYLTDGFINGLNAFSPKVIFNDTRDELYCDRVDTGHDMRIQSGDVPECLKPAGLHCHFANEQQAFHYGVHRALKGQRSILDKVLHAWKRDRDRIRGFALLGMHYSDQFVQNRRFNYADSEFVEAFKQASEEYDKHILSW